MTRREALEVLEDLKAMARAARGEALRVLPRPAVRAIVEEWWWQAHEGQLEPDSDWRIWSIVAGRGFGKTRAGAEWVWARARECPGARIALLAASAEEVARVMVEGESGLRGLARCDEKPRWFSSKGELRFPSGARAFAYSAAQPDQLRGPQHHFAWADELAKWPKAEAAWHNLMLGLRLGDRPRAIVTTTPRPVPLLGTIMKLERSEVTRGATVDNPHLPADFIEAMTQMYGGTRLGRQELEGVLFQDVEGALWTREMLEGSRQSGTLPREGVVRTVVGVDPPASESGTCGIIVCGVDGDGVAWVLADLSSSGLRPEGWARRVAAAAEQWDAERVVAERNQGGDMVASVLRGVDVALPVKLVTATRSKAERAAPVALRFETGRARLAGRFPELEDQLCAFTHRGWQGQGSPDRADAMVWAMTELIRERGRPQVRGL